ncbi:hypothetical protein BDN72DRAFT_859252 [Pluteus cervinus]|uniref:Uncharacterized protein n=1 Tax=Pluteus cervinus TaxID=181527 RepID=A0ACD3ANQ5_9AGAR|nr:hypothetical protein BDN72DRAFT_859252 [Pluteus cervinus]
MGCDDDDDDDDSAGVFCGCINLFCLPHMPNLNLRFAVLVSWIVMAIPNVFTIWYDLNSSYDLESQYVLRAYHSFSCGPQLAGPLIVILRPAIQPKYNPTLVTINQPMVVPSSATVASYKLWPESQVKLYMWITGVGSQYASSPHSIGLDLES